MTTPRHATSSLRDDSPWREGRVGIFIMFIFFIVLGGWSAFAPLDAAVVAQGVVKVSGNRQVVQHQIGRAHV